jgi:hypothetical protein
MDRFEMKLRIGGETLILDRTEIRVILLRRGERFSDLAARIGCSRENLARLLNGKKNFPNLRKGLERELSRMLAKRPSGGQLTHVA